jgi:hypothetical protein
LLPLFAADARGRVVGIWYSSTLVGQISSSGLSGNFIINQIIPISHDNNNIDEWYRIDSVGIITGMDVACRILYW